MHWARKLYANGDIEPQNCRNQEEKATGRSKQDNKVNCKIAAEIKRAESRNSLGSRQVKNE